MPTPVDNALRRLRAADPARGTEPAPWLGSPAQLRTVDREADAEITPLPLPQHRPRWLLAGVAGAGVVLLSVAVAAIGARHSSDSTGTQSLGSQSPGARSIVPSVAPASGPADENYQRTHDLVVRLAAEFPVLPQATQRATAPTPDLTEPGSEPGSSDLVSATEWWTAPGSLDAALAYYRAQVSDGLKENGTSSGGDSHAKSFEGIFFGGADRSFATDITVLVRLVPTPSGVAVRVDAQAVWRPTRPTAETIVAPSAVTVTVERPSADTVTRTLGQAAAQHLADVVNALPLTTPGVRNCPMDTGRDRDTVRFTAGSGPIEVIANGSGCRDVSVTVNGALQPGLADGKGGLDRAVLAALGLPANYGR